jgi:hypothetical protein
MEHGISGRLHWDTTHTATPRWMLPGYDTRLPREASHAEVAHLIGEMLSRETGHRVQQVQITPIEEGTGYTFVAMDMGPT